HVRQTERLRDPLTEGFPHPGKPSAPDRHNALSLLARECRREAAFSLALRVTGPPLARLTPAALIPSRPASKTLRGHGKHDRPDRQLRQLHVQPVPLSVRTTAASPSASHRPSRSR